jgi:uncharacterized membrane protein YobD (UPF0266 family)
VLSICVCFSGLSAILVVCQWRAAAGGRIVLVLASRVTVLTFDKFIFHFASSLVFFVIVPYFPAYWLPYCWATRTVPPPKTRFVLVMEEMRILVYHWRV